MKVARNPYTLQKMMMLAMLAMITSLAGQSLAEVLPSPSPQAANQPVTVTLSSAAGNPVAGPFMVAADFGGTVNDFTSTSLLLSNARVSRITRHTYTQSIAVGAYHVAALGADGKVSVWGDNSKGQCAVPAGLNNVVSISAHGYRTLALKADGTIVMWGTGTNNVPTGLGPVVAIASGWNFDLALRPDGTVAAWGINYDGQCNVPAGLNGIVAIAAGSYHGMALRADGTVVAWGWNSNGQSNTPADQGGIVGIAGMPRHSLALRADGTVAAWGANYWGVCDVPAGLKNVVALAGDDEHNVVLLTDGRLAAWGDNTYNQVSTASTLSNVVQIASNDHVDAALCADGKVVVWGSNAYGQCVVPSGLVGHLPTYSRYNFEVTPLAVGQVKVQLPAGATTALGGGQNLASNLLTRNYVLPGIVQVRIEPARAVTYGAAWRRVGTTTWRASGTTEGLLAPGNYKVEFKPLSAYYTRPADAPVTIQSGQTTQVMRIYNSTRNQVARDAWIHY